MSAARSRLSLPSVNRRLEDILQRRLLGPHHLIALLTRQSVTSVRNSRGEGEPVTFPEARERAKAFGVFSAIAGGGGAVALLLGGVLTEYVDWRWCLYVNVVFAVVAAAGAAGGGHARSEPPNPHRPPG